MFLKSKSTFFVILNASNIQKPTIRWYKNNIQGGFYYALFSYKNGLF